jgi:signal transduction histidine kinase
MSGGAGQPHSAREALLLQLVDGLPCAFALFDPADRLILCNRGLLELCSGIADLLTPGQRFEDLIRLSAARGIYAGSPQEVEAHVRFRLEMHQRRQGAHEQRLADGRCLQIVERPLPDGSTLGVWTDITDLRRQEDALSIIVGHRSLGMCFLTAAARALAVGLGCRWAGTAELLPGLHQAKLLSYWSDGAPGELFTYDLAATPCAQLYKGEPSDQRYCVHPDGLARLFPEDEILKGMGAVSYQGAAFLDEAGNRIGHVFAIDDKPAAPGERGERFVQLIADWVGMELRRRRAEQALHEAKDEAERADRTKSEFLANMSHELRTPLNAIIGFSEIMRGEVLGPLGGSRYLDYADHIFQSGNHLLALINDILDVSKAAAGKITLHEEPIDCVALVEACLCLVESGAARAGVALTRELPSALPRLLADERRLKQVLLNLLSNAIKFTPRGGRIRISATAEARDGFVFTVSDTGIGIASADIERVLQPFGQVDSALSRRSEGAGLGLPLTKSLVELHGGSLRIDSELGGGTTVTVRLPGRRIIPAAVAE